MFLIARPTTKMKISDNERQTNEQLPKIKVEQEPVRMKKNVGLISGISLIVGTIIGSGIFISPKGVLTETGSVGLSLIVWTAGGLLSLLGGEYPYLMEGLGRIVAYLFAWTKVVVLTPSSLAIICLTFAEYLVTFFPFCGNPQIPLKLIAALAIVTLGIINSFDTKLAASVQVLFTAAKLIAIGIIIIGGLNGFEGTTNSPAKVALAFYDCLWAYDGWNNLNYVIEELKNPYSWGEDVLGPVGIIMPLFVMCSTFGAANGSLFAGGRTVYVAARENQLPEILSYVNCKRYTPIPSITFTCAIALAMLIPLDIGGLIDFFSFAAWLFYAMTILSLLILKWKMKDAPRPIRLNVVLALIFMVCSLYLVVAPIIQDPRIEFLYAFLFIVGGLLLYFPLIPSPCFCSYFLRLRRVLTFRMNDISNTKVMHNVNFVLCKLIYFVYCHFKQKRNPIHACIHNLASLCFILRCIMSQVLII
ncbi:hypothetical protein KUTeg_019715 [Tegillarca granosa]|uniref:Uncharacterized protein n=1 Tax=Tegillarca granosa TaxID=220873 RepID=A0ABQ9EDB5_TEGGR|nr:hypothetical protein KUTeg_019715 [Tegillarca granosa]